MSTANSTRNLHKRFWTAIKDKNLKLARDLVANMLPDSGTVTRKTLAYRAILDCAIDVGEIEIALEVAPFSGRKISENDIRECLRFAIKGGKYKEAILCKERLGEDFAMEEITTLRDAILKKQVLLPHMFNILVHLRSNDAITEVLLKIIRKHIPNWKLDPGDRLLLEIMKIVA